MDVVIPFWRRAPAIVQPKPAPEYFIVEARDSHPGCPNKYMRAYWVELWDGYPESETTIVWQGDAYPDARRACAEMLSGYTEEGANCCVIDHVAHRGARCAETDRLITASPTALIALAAIRQGDGQ